MNRLFLFMLICVDAVPLFAQLDVTLVRQAEHWKSGDVPPPRLLKFPDGKIDEFPMCGMRTEGSAVSDYISRIRNPDLLAALLLDYRAEPETLHAAARQLITLKGIDHVARLLASHRRECAKSQLAVRSELAVLAELLRLPYAVIQVLRITKDDMELSAAERALQEMRTDLNAGTTWDNAYLRACGKYPDAKPTAKNPGRGPRLICYLFDGLVSPSGFDILRYNVATDLLPEHLQEIFRVGRGTRIFKTTEAVYLYQIAPR